MVIALCIVAIIAVAVVLFMQQPQFGKNPSPEHQLAFVTSPHFKDGVFENIHYTPSLTEGNTMLGVAFAQIFKTAPHRRPMGMIPSVRTELANLNPKENVLIWFGHSSYYMQLDGKKFLVDPVFSGNAAPVSGMITAFDGTQRYSVDDLPEIDYLLITHDHYDHVDYHTLLPLRAKVKTVICGLGVGAHFESWGYDTSRIIEKDWHQTIDLGNGFSIVTSPTRHFSGRGLTRNTTLWMSYLVQTPTQKIYVGGDSGYDTHFAELGNKYGPIDLAILENGQYDARWKYIHMLPEEVLQATQDLRAKSVFPVHSGKFALANHSWDEPLKRITEHNKKLGLRLVTPMIGQAVQLADTTQEFPEWWRGIE